MNQKTKKSVPVVGLAQILLGLLWTGIALVLTSCGGKGEEGGGEKPPPPAVVATVVEAEDVKVYEDYAGRVRGSREVEVRARVSGILEERLYLEGEHVEQGEPLFQIEREPYEIALKQAQAELANSQANYNQAEREWNRVKGLFKENAVSERERDRALSQLELAEAQVELSEARLARAQLDLDYTQVQASLSGPTGLETHSEGSLIERGNLLTTIVQQNPIHIRFSLPERDAAVQRLAREAMRDEGGNHRREVQLMLPDGREYDQLGVVDFTDSTIDPRTGTVSARAVFENPEGKIIPGQFVRVRMQLRNYQDVLRIQSSAVSEGREGPRVFVLKENNTVVARGIELGPVINNRQIVLDGLSNGDKVVTEGHVNLQDGMNVTVENVEEEDQ